MPEPITDTQRHRFRVAEWNSQGNADERFYADQRRSFQNHRLPITHRHVFIGQLADDQRAFQSQLHVDRSNAHGRRRPRTLHAHAARHGRRRAGGNAAAGERGAATIVRMAAFNESGSRGLTAHRPDRNSQPFESDGRRRCTAQIRNDSDQPGIMRAWGHTERSRSYLFRLPLQSYCTSSGGCTGANPNPCPPRGELVWIKAMKTKGEIEAAVCTGMSHFQQEYIGRGPKAIHAHLIGDLLVVRLQGVLTAAEQHLVKSQSPEKGRDLLKQVRAHLIEVARPLLEAMIENETGVKVLSLHHDVSTLTGEELTVFTLADGPLFRSAVH